MNLLNPAALAWAALALPIIGFYILKIRLRRVPVSTVMFWREIFEQKQPRSLWEHLRHLLSLMVQLAMLGLLIFALAEPFFRWDKQGARRIVLIVDNSASMNATDKAPSRLDVAKGEAGRIIDGLRFTDEMAVLAAGTEPQVACGLTDHQSTLREALAGIRPTDGPTKVQEAVELARRLLADQKDPAIVVLTDGGFDGAAALDADPSVRVVAIGGRVKADNLGITRLQARRSLVDPIGYEILVEVTNASEKPAGARIELELDGQPIDVVPLKIEPGASWSQTFEKTSADGGRLAAVITSGDEAKPYADALAVDDRAVALLPRRDPKPVLLVTKGNLFLRKVFEAIPLVLLRTADAIPSVTPSGGVTVYHKTVPATLPPGPILVIDPQSETDLFEVGERLASPLVAKQDKDSPLMAHVRLDNVGLPDARAITPRGKATVLAQTLAGEPLYLAFDRPSGTVVVLTVDLDQSDLPFQTAFPILMANALAEFSGGKGELREAVPAGGLAEVELPGVADRVLVAPDGSERPLPSGGGRVSAGPLDRCGVWTIARREAATPGQPVARLAEAEIACNLASRRESDLRPPAEWKPNRPAVAAGFGGRPVWYYLIAVAWLLAGLEWFLYQRRWIS